MEPKKKKRETPEKKRELRNGTVEEKSQKIRGVMPWAWEKKAGAEQVTKWELDGNSTLESAFLLVL